MRIVLSGPPGVGKTTTVKRVAEVLGELCWGFYTEEVRRRGKRWGFVAVNVRTGERCILASVDTNGPRVGKYGVNVEGFSAFLERVKGDGILLLDEIGPMELKVPKFHDFLSRARRAERFLVTAHRSLAQRVAQEFRAELVWMDFSNRDEVQRRVVTLFSSLKGGKEQ